MNDSISSLGSAMEYFAADGALDFDWFGCGGVRLPHLREGASAGAVGRHGAETSSEAGEGSRVREEETANRGEVDPFGMAPFEISSYEEAFHLGQAEQRRRLRPVPLAREQPRRRFCGRGGSSPTLRRVDHPQQGQTCLRPPGHGSDGEKRNGPRRHWQGLGLGGVGTERGLAGVGQVLE